MLHGTDARVRCGFFLPLGGFRLSGRHDEGAQDGLGAGRTGRGREGRAYEEGVRDAGKRKKKVVLVSSLLVGGAGEGLRCVSWHNIHVCGEEKGVWK